jgi:hypothetical protein
MQIPYPVIDSRSVSSPTSSEVVELHGGGGDHRLGGATAQGQQREVAILVAGERVQCDSQGHGDEET